MNNRLYCTFVEPNEINEISKKIQSSYKVLFDKIFVLESLDGEKVMLTYNVDLGNSNGEFAIGNTILVHRKKQTNTLYTINALNELIKSLNNGVLDKSYSINWDDYKNCILLVQADGYKKIKKENHKEMTKAKLFNYLIQSKETDQNMYTLSVIHTALKKFKTKIVLYNYDAFVFDFCDVEYDGLFKTLEHIVSDEYPISIKKGNHYGALYEI